MNIVALKALFFAGGATFLAFLMARIAFSDVVGRQRMDNWFILYGLITLSIFLISNFWIFLLVLFVLTLIFGSREPVMPAIFALLVLSVPAKGAWLSGFGVVQNLLYVVPSDIVQIAVVVLALIRFSEPNNTRMGGGIADKCFILFAIVAMMLSFRDTTFTNGLRICVVFILSSMPAYFIFSRMRWTEETIKVTTIALMVPLIALSGVAVLEVLTSWHFYSAAIANWGIPYRGIYILREGFLRAYGTLLGPIAFGAILMVGLALAPAVIQSMNNKFLGRLGFLGLGGGILAALSRAPWIGTGIVFVLHALTDKKAASSLGRLALIGVACLAVLAVTPFGSSVINTIPGLGDDSHDETISYRQELLRVGVNVVRDNPFFGSTEYLERDDLEELRQGQGVIDLVNTYLHVAMNYGLVGLTLFLAVKFLAFFSIWRSIARARIVLPELAPYCQAYFAALGGLLFVLFTTTNTIGQFEQVIWMIVGTSIGLTRVVNEAWVKAGGKAPVLAPQTAMEDTPVEEKEIKGAGVASPALARQPVLDPSNLPPHLRQYAKRTD